MAMSRAWRSVLADARWLCALGLCVGLATACGNDDGGGAVAAVDTLCTDGTRKCLGNALLTCASDGKAWKVANCGEAKVCGQGQGGLGCQPVDCVPNSKSCDDNKAMQCPADGQGDPSQVEFCVGAEHCVAGTCVKTACTSGDKLCGWKALLSCNGGGWSSQKCGANERCDAAKKACVERTCEPTTIACKDNTTSQTCNTEGSAWIVSACKAGQVCRDGVCHAKVKGKDDIADAGATDTGATSGDAANDAAETGGFLDVQKDEFVFEPLDKLTVYKSTKAPIPEGTLVFEYDISSASYLSLEQMMQITGNQNLEKIEIACAPVEEFTTGSTNELEQRWPNSSVLMNDGTNDPAVAQFRYQAIEYSITIKEFPDVGGRLKGSFNATMADVMIKGKTFYVEGAFDIKRTQ